MSDLKIQRTLPIAGLDEESASFGGADRDMAVAISREAWKVAGQPTVVTVTVERVR